MFAVYVKNLHVHDIKRHETPSHSLPIHSTAKRLFNACTLNWHIVFHLNKTLQLFH